mgnify:CR=1 FL=1
MQSKAIFKTTILTIFGLCAFSTQASELEIPNTFEDGQVTSASEINANFEAIEAAVNDNNVRISAALPAQFLGFTPTTFNQGSGFFAAQKMCHDWIANSYVCRPNEVADTPYSATAIATIIDGEHESAWLAQIDAWNPLHNCDNFKINVNIKAASGYVVDSDGWIGMKAECGIPRALACCK